MRPILEILLILIVSTTVCRAQAHFEISERVGAAYDLIFDLRLDSARALLAEERKLFPNNAILPLFESYADFIQAFISESETDYGALTDELSRRLSEVRKGPESDAYYLYCQAEIWLHTALVALKHDAYFTAFRYTSRAYRMLRSNAKQFPQFTANNKSLGLLRALIGTIPDSYQWGLEIFGIEGDIHDGADQIKKVMQDDIVFGIEASIVYALVMLHLSQNEDKAVQTIDMYLPKDDRLLVTYIRASIALNTKQTDRARLLLNSVKMSGDQMNFEYLNYLKGLIALYQLDSMAIKYLERFTQEFKGRHFIKDAYLKLVWADELFNNGNNVEKYLKACKREGARTVDEDKSAYHQATNYTPDHPQLLRARLLFDGGYYEEARKVIVELDRSGLTEMEKLVALYRSARIDGESKAYREALSNYEKVIAMKSSEGSYFRKNSWLQIGLIYERLSQTSKARAAFRESLACASDQYAASLDQKALAGLNRTENKDQK